MEGKYIEEKITFYLANFTVYAFSSIIYSIKIIV